MTGNSASIGGVITDSNDPFLVGFGITFTVVDNTPVAADLISFEQVLEPFQVPAANTPNCGNDVPPTFALTNGDIVVQDSAAGGGDDDDDEDDDDEDDETTTMTTTTTIEG